MCPKCGKKLDPVEVVVKQPLCSPCLREQKVKQDRIRAILELLTDAEYEEYLRTGIIPA